MADPSVLVGVGASAGGLEAFHRLLAELPEDSALAFVLVQHLAPHHESLLSQLLDRASPLPVQEATDGARVEAGHVYVIPPNHFLALRDGRLRLERPKYAANVRLPVDYLFHSLAEEAGTRAAGVVLSGAGRDGSRGLRALQAAGGLTIAQRPDTAEHPSMPQQAIELRAADLVLDIEDMAEALARFSELPPGARDTILSPAPEDLQAPLPGAERALPPEALEEIAVLLDGTGGVHASSYKRSILARRAQRRMLLAGFEDTATFLAALRADPQQRWALVRDLLIGVTRFFRDPPAFRALARILGRELTPPPDSAGGRSAEEPLRIWVPGCATGEEAYSIVMLCQELRGDVPRADAVRVFATDVDRQALAVARAGIYAPNVARDVPAPLRERYFRGEPGRRLAITSPVRDAVTFAEHDLTRDPPFSRIDLVCCRNVLIYLQPEAQQGVLDALHFALRDQGLLLLGSSESVLARPDGFRPLDEKHRIYQRNGSDRKRGLARRAPPIERARSSVPGERPRRRGPGGAGETARDQLLASLPPTVLVDAHDLVTYTRGDLGPYLRIPEGPVELKLDQVVAERYRRRVHTAVARCRQQHRPWATDVAAADDRPTRRVRITARPCPPAASGAVAVTFELDGHVDPAPPGAHGDAPPSALERELDRTRSDLDNALAELAGVRDELARSREDSSAVNEELQSANEELEASSEELRSLNEELSTVNAQLREHLGQLREARDDLQNVLESARLPMLILDRDLRLRRYTPAAAELLGLDEGLEGHPVATLGDARFRQGLERDARQVLEAGAPSSRVLALGDGPDVDRRIFPYRAEDDRIDGVVVVLVDISEQRRAMRAAQQSEERLRIAERAAGMGILDYDVAAGKVDWDERMRRLAGLGAHEPADVDTLRRVVATEDRAALAAAIDAALDPARREAIALELRLTAPDREGARWVSVAGHPFFRDGRAVRLVLAVLDITERKAHERMRARHQAIVTSSGDPILSQGLDGTILSWNPAAERLLGHAGAEMIGRDDDILVPEGRRAERDALLERAAAGEIVHDHQTVRLRRDGSVVDVSLTVTRIEDGTGSITGYATVMRDLTENLFLIGKIRDQTATLELAARAAGLGTFDIDLEAQTSRWSPELRRSFGLDEGEPPPFHPMEAGFIHPDDVEQLRRKTDASLEPDGPAGFGDEHRILRRDGGERWLVVNSRTFFTGEGAERRPTRVVGAALDITERKQAELALADSERRLRRLFDLAPVQIAVFEGPDHVLSYANAAQRRALGSLETGRPIDVAIPNLRESVRERLDHAFREGREIMLEEIDLLAREGTRDQVRFYTLLLQPRRGPDGAVEGVISFAQDNTPEVTLRREVEASEQRFRILAENIAQLAWMADGRGFVFWYNRRWYEYTGGSPEESRGWEWRRFHHPDHVDRVVAKLRRCFEEGEPWEDTFPLRSARGEYRWFLSRAQPIRDVEGRVLRWLGTNTDITDQLETEQRLREADRRKDEFLAMLGHELRNPLAAVQSGIELLGLSAGAAPPPVQRATAVLARQAAHMGRLVDGLLEISRISRGQLELELGPVDLVALIREVADDQVAARRTRGLELTTELPEGPVWVDADRTRLWQVLENLLNNAVKFTPPPGRIHLHLEADGTHVLVSVKDTGMGIPLSLLRDVFEPFRQSPQDLARSGGGLGLGLALCRGIVELHGGTIEALSEGEGRGAEMRVRLPASEPPQAAAEEPESPPAAPERRILLVEDNPDAALMLSDLLTALGHEVVHARCGDEALGQAAAAPFDLVLCDLGLPGISGLEVARRLRAIPAFEGTRLVALTGYGQASDRADSLAAGFDEHLVKPVELARLEELLADLC